MTFKDMAAYCPPPAPPCRSALAGRALAQLTKQQNEMMAMPSELRAAVPAGGEDVSTPKGGKDADDEKSGKKGKKNQKVKKGK